MSSVKSSSSKEDTSDEALAAMSRSVPTSPTSPTPTATNGQTLQIKQLSTTIMNHLQWMNDWSPTSFFQNFLLSNPFRRRNSKPSNDSDGSKRRSADLSDMNHMNHANDTNKPIARFLNGTLIPTAKSRELIELANFDILEIDDSERGIGHNFKKHSLSAPTWCDSCGEFLWTPVVGDDDQRVASSYVRYLQCTRCKYICHLRCRILVRIDCQGVAETPYLMETLSRPSSPIFRESYAFKLKIVKYNEKRSSKGSGLGITIVDENKQTFRGFLRVHMNLTRPINVISGRRPPSIYDIINEDETNTARRQTLTSFYMPRDTVKNIHITSENTSREVIKAMLKKFKVVDNPQKFALYLSFTDSLTNMTVLKRIGDQEKPLRIQLEYDDDSDEKLIVLQENDTADIAWDAFEVPELNNFLKILDREEKEHLSQVILRYQLIRENISKIIKAEQPF